MACADLFARPVRFKPLRPRARSHRIGGLTDRTLQKGATIAGRYVVEGLLGHGGMGAVYAARHEGTGRRFALKLLHPDLAGEIEAEARFLREATLASAINHPAIVEVYDVGRHGDAPYMVLKLLAGESLGARLLRTRMSPEEALEIILPVLDGVAAAHAHGILHRDLKPDNIMLHREGATEQPKILDFGISKLLGADARTRLTKTGISLGTPLYMSPEQVRGDHEVDLRADVYALGIILYQMLTGRLPYDGNNYPDLVLKIVDGGAPGIRHFEPGLSLALERVVERAMAVARSDRHASVTELAAELRALQNARAGSLRAEPKRSLIDSLRVAAMPAQGRRVWLWSAIAAVAVASFAVALWFGRSSPPVAAAIESPPRNQPAPRVTLPSALSAANHTETVNTAKSPTGAVVPAALEVENRQPPGGAASVPRTELPARDTAARTARERSEARPRRQAPAAEDAPQEPVLKIRPTARASEIIDPFEH